jgi:hypothetical protein
LSTPGLVHYDANGCFGEDVDTAFEDLLRFLSRALP